MSVKLYFTFLISIFLVQFKTAKPTEFKGSIDVSDGIIIYANLFPFPNYKLNSPPFETRTVDVEQDCIEACTDNSRCRSLNFKQVPELNGKFICHLLDTDKFNSSELFNTSLDSHHYSFTAPCELHPCKNGGTCYPVKGAYDFKCACVPSTSLGGKRCDKMLKSCAELLDAGFTESGIYKIRFNQSQVIDVYCDQSSWGGGWTMVFKVVSGVSANGSSSSQLWSSSETINENKTETLNVNSSFRAHYKNRFVPNWRTVDPKEARVTLYTNGSEILSIVFNAVNSDNNNWFSKNRITHSPWTDLGSEPQNFFSIGGCCSGRDFYISRNHGGCENDAGWLAISGPDCAWETRLPHMTVLYTNRKTYTNWNQYGKNTRSFSEPTLPLSGGTGNCVPLDKGNAGSGNEIGKNNVRATDHSLLRRRSLARHEILPNVGEDCVT